MAVDMYDKGVLRLEWINHRGSFSVDLSNDLDSLDRAQHMIHKLERDYGITAKQYGNSLFIEDPKSVERFQGYLGLRAKAGTQTWQASSNEQYLKTDISSLEIEDKGKLLQELRVAAVKKGLSADAIQFGTDSAGHSVILMPHDIKYHDLTEHLQKSAEIPKLSGTTKFFEKHGKKLGWIGAGAVALAGAFMSGKAKADEGGSLGEVASAAAGGAADGIPVVNSAKSANEGRSDEAIARAADIIPPVGEANRYLQRLYAFATGQKTDIEAGMFEDSAYLMKYAAGKGNEWINALQNWINQSIKEMAASEGKPIDPQHQAIVNQILANTGQQASVENEDKPQHLNLAHS